jgi:hypothetical protein
MHPELPSAQILDFSFAEGLLELCYALPEHWVVNAVVFFHGWRQVRAITYLGLQGAPPPALAPLLAGLPLVFSEFRCRRGTCNLLWFGLRVGKFRTRQEIAYLKELASVLPSLFSWFWTLECDDR